MTHSFTPAVGDSILVRDARGDVCAGGVVLAVDASRVTVAQPYRWMHNGVEVERGTNEFSVQRATHSFELRAA